MAYADLLKDPRWQKKRLEIMERAGWKCELCGNRTLTLHVHHTRYDRRRKPWQYENRELLCICEVCHGKLHGLYERPVPEENPTEQAPERLEIKHRIRNAANTTELNAALDELFQYDLERYRARAEAEHANP
jgi:5-methylcytosine-specific restriction endonuclease McrA